MAEVSPNNDGALPGEVNGVSEAKRKLHRKEKEEMQKKLEKQQQEIQALRQDLAGPALLQLALGK